MTLRSLVVLLIGVGYEALLGVAPAFAHLALGAALWLQTIVGPPQAIAANFLPFVPSTLAKVALGAALAVALRRRREWLSQRIGFSTNRSRAFFGSARTRRACPASATI